MRIADIRSIPLQIPFRTGGAATELSGKQWSGLDFVLVRIELENGIVGWGDAFAYHCREAVHAAIETMVKPIALGRDVREISHLMSDLQRKLHLFGRYGITMFALSGLDIALWDALGKLAKLPLCELLGGHVNKKIPGYASLFNYSDPEIVAEKTKQCVSDGYDYVKLHETGLAEVAAARETAGKDIGIMVDANCPWTIEEANRMALAFMNLDILWLEEPIFPPEDFRALARLRHETGVAIATGENACTAFQFKQMIDTNAANYVQPSVTKVGGITEFQKIATLAETSGVSLMPHAPYFGPGFLATLHLMAAIPNSGLAEWFYLEREACLYGGAIAPENGGFKVPDGPGLGIDPDPDVIKDYTVD